ncbi:hypothetical protein [Lichenibacterium dinghuense]|uniref:hypothetical protein n=1 Tax=Lichenibacterium dinghuense TaxID=2895977 RepID=UPI001F3D3D4A|nr:hypothetical protein [Lichenibacterium sp. 6Y81]
MWSSDDLSFEIEDAGTQDPVVTVEITTPDGKLVVMGEPRQDGRTLVVEATHIHGVGFRPNDLGSAKLRTIARALLERMDYDGLIVEGATRTTGAQKGRRPKPLRFSRGPRPAPRP